MKHVSLLPSPAPPSVLVSPLFVPALQLEIQFVQEVFPCLCILFLYLRKLFLCPCISILCPCTLFLCPCTLFPYLLTLFLCQCTLLPRLCPTAQGLLSDTQRLSSPTAPSPAPLTRVLEYPHAEQNISPPCLALQKC